MSFISIENLRSNLFRNSMSLHAQVLAPCVIERETSAVHIQPAFCTRNNLYYIRKWIDNTTK